MARSMRILHVTQGYVPAIGGTELLIQRVSEELVQRYGDEVTVFTTDCYNAEAFFTPGSRRLPTGLTEINGVRVRRFPVRSDISRALRLPEAIAHGLRLPGNDRIRAWAGGPIIPGLRAAIARQPAEIIAASSFPLLHMFDALEGAHASGRPCVLHGALHPEDVSGFERPMIYRAIRAADAYISNTSFEADLIIRRGAAAERVHTVGVGVDLQPYEGITIDDAKWRAGFDRRPVVGFIAQLARHKGLGTLLAAMPRVWSCEPDVNLLIAGGRTSFTGEVEQTIAGWPERYRRRVGYFPDFPSERKPWLFSAIDLLAYPSAYESFGIAYLEAWATGKPVIGVRSGAVPAVIDEGVDGLLLDRQDDRMLTDAILSLLQNEAAARAMGAAGRAKVRAQYTWPMIADRFRQVYSRVLQDSVASRRMS
jgi:glycosyltransferase involved in cell wall biosynthesis